MDIIKMVAYQAWIIWVNVQLLWLYKRHVWFVTTQWEIQFIDIKLSTI